MLLTIHLSSGATRLNQPGYWKFMTESIWLWVGFNGFVLAMLALDLGVFHRKAHVVSLKESLTWTFVWIGL